MGLFDEQIGYVLFEKAIINLEEIAKELKRYNDFIEKKEISEVAQKGHVNSIYSVEIEEEAKRQGISIPMLVDQENVGTFLLDEDFEYITEDKIEKLEEKIINIVNDLGYHCSSVIIYPIRKRHNMLSSITKRAVNLLKIDILY